MLRNVVFCDFLVGFFYIIVSFDDFINVKEETMTEKTNGNVIKKIREERGYTQSQVSDGICSISTLSRIENDNHKPGRAMCGFILERLGESEDLFDEYFGDYDYEIYYYFNKINACMERSDFDEGEKLLNELRHFVEKRGNLNEKSKEIYTFIEILFASLYFVRENSGKRIELQQFGVYIHRELEGKYKRLFEENDEILLDKVELRIVNAFGIGCFLERNYQLAIDTWMKLINILYEKGDHPKEMAVLYNNLTIGLIGMEMLEEAEIFMRKAISFAMDGANIRIYVKILYNRCVLLAKKGDETNAYRDLALLQNIIRTSKHSFSDYKMTKKLPSEPYLIQFF